MIIISRLEVWMFTLRNLRKYLKNDDTVEILNIHGEGFRLVDKN